MFPSEVSVFIESDGSVTFTDLTGDMARIAETLDPKANAATESED